MRRLPREIAEPAPLLRYLFHAQRRNRSRRDHRERQPDAKTHDETCSEHELFQLKTKQEDSDRRRTWYESAGQAEHDDLSRGDILVRKAPLDVIRVREFMRVAGDVSLFLPIEHACLAESSSGHVRTALFARYSFMGAVSGALGALLAGTPDWINSRFGIPALTAMRGMFVIYALAGVAIALLYLQMSAQRSVSTAQHAPLGPSRSVVTRLALLFSVDAFAGGLVVNALLTLWLITRFDLSITTAGQFFFCTGLLSAASQLAAAPLARRIGLLNTMVFTHMPSSLCLIAAAFASSLPVALLMLLMRSALSQLDVPTRSAYVMAVVTPAERAAAASFTAVPRSLAAAVAPTLAGGLIGFGWLGAPLVACGVLKIAYDLALLGAFRRVPPRGESA